MNPWKLIALAALGALTLSVGSQIASGFGVCHDKPNMAAANQALHQARGYLAKAEDNNGGWRVAAIAAADKAVAESDRGCAFADTH